MSMDMGADDEGLELEFADDASDGVDGEDVVDDGGIDDSDIELQGTELENFEAAEIENLEILSEEQIRSVVESALFATDKPISIAVIKQAFKGTQVKSKDIRETLKLLMEEYAGVQRGFDLHEVAGGFQLRTKPENMRYLRQGVKARPFRLSGPALEVLSIVAYKQPTTKAQIDEIRGVESGHLLRALMEKHLVTFGERSDLPGKPMFYETTRKFLEIFGLRNLAELPNLHEIDQLIPEGIGEVEDKETLSDLTGKLSQEAGPTYSEGEDELLKITDELTQITTSSEFFEEEKRRQREKRDRDRAQDLREALTVGEKVEERDLRWLERYDAGQAEQAAAEQEVDFVVAPEGESLADAEVAVADVSAAAAEVIASFDADTHVAAEPEPGTATLSAAATATATAVSSTAAAAAAAAAAGADLFGAPKDSDPGPELGPELS